MEYDVESFRRFWVISSQNQKEIYFFLKEVGVSFINNLSFERLILGFLFLEL